jgi:diguanylate cyclase (GGDEF)-like protein
MTSPTNTDPFDRIADLEEQLRLAHDLVDQLRHDCVSGLIGRRTFEELLSASFGQAERAKFAGDERRIGVIFIDTDHFKRVNDDYGHRVGDDVISAVAGAIKSCTRSTDHAARWGGDEFACLVGQADLMGLALLSERIRGTVENLSHPGIAWPVTVSVGFALQTDEDTNPKDIVERADIALFSAKEAGRNRVGRPVLGPDELRMIETIDSMRGASE